MNEPSKNEPTPPAPEKISIGQAREQAKDLIRAFRARDIHAVRRMQIALPELSITNHVFAAELALKDARRTIAIEHGFEDWQQLLTKLS